SVGPRPGRSFVRLDLAPVLVNSVNRFKPAPVVVLAYVTPNCGLCEPIPGFVEAYNASAPTEARSLVSFALATDAREDEAIQFAAEQDLRVPLLRHAELASHYELTKVGAPYLLALADLKKATD